jgi:cation diffusion facilitator family transporter
MVKESQYFERVEIGAWISIISYLILAALKVTIGHFSHSEALIADGLNNSTDIVASVAVLIGVKLSKKPPDDNHPYGHRRAEIVASLFASFVMMSVGINVIYTAAKSMYTLNVHTPTLTAAYTALFSALAMYFVYLYNKKLAEKTKSQALMAAAKDNLSDALVSIGTAIGIFGAQLNLPWLDPLTALIVGVMICKTAFEIFKDAAYQLTDGFAEEDLEMLKEVVLSVHGVKAVNSIKARHHGNEIFVDVVIEVDPNLDVVESHVITENIEKQMNEEFNIRNVHIHVEPLSK